MLLIRTCTIVWDRAISILGVAVASMAARRSFVEQAVKAFEKCYGIYPQWVDGGIAYASALAESGNSAGAASSI